MTKWHDQIPPQGVAIHIKDDDFEEIVVLKTEHLERFAPDELDVCTPLTADEMWALMPWQSIDTVPTNTPVFVIESGVFQRCAFEWNSEYWVISGIDEPADDFHPTKWLPLPNVER